MKRIIYYFSGTGNSLYAAKYLAKYLKADLLPIGDLEAGCDIEATMIGFVFPVYEFKPPKLVLETIEKAGNLGADYVFAVATYGVTMYKALGPLEEVLRSKGLGLSSGFGLHMPHNAVGSVRMPYIRDRHLLKESPIELGRIADHVARGAILPLEKGGLKTFMGYRKALPYFFKLMGHLIRYGGQSLAFETNDECLACGLCQRVCSNNNIEMVKGRPVFLDQCTSCFACVQYCPKHALTFGGISMKSMGIKSYHHPACPPNQMGQTLRKSFKSN